MTEGADKTEADKQTPPPWNGDTYGPALVHAATVSPVWSAEQWAELWNDDRWNMAELRRLFETADNLTVELKVVDLGED